MGFRMTGASTQPADGTACGPPILATARLLLRPWRQADREPFRALNADPQVMRYFPAPLDAAASDRLADRIEANMAMWGFGLWAVEVRCGPAFVGFVGLSVPAFAAHFTPCVEVGWRLARAAWGRGYATEAAEAALRFGFVEERLDEIVSITVPSNRASRAVMERLGMHHMPADFAHPSLPEDHPLRPHVLYRLRRDAWLARARA
jgi:ribosomal-protein-alanine N-acetyltransferase